MRAFLAVLVLLVALGHADGQTDAGSSAPNLKLTGVALKATPDGYFVVSVPIKDIPRVIKVAEMLVPHVGLLIAMERASIVAEKADRVVSRSPEVRAGIVFLSTSEVFPKLFKIIDRYVQQNGVHDYVNSRGEPTEVPEFQGGPMER